MNRHSPRKEATHRKLMLNTRYTCMLIYLYYCNLSRCVIFFPSFSADLSERDKQNAVRKICGRAAPKLAKREPGTLKKKKRLGSYVSMKLKLLRK